MALTKLDIANAVEGITAVANGGTGRSSDNRGLFYVYSGADQNIGSNAYTTVALNTEVFDLDSYFNTSNYRYIPQVAGYYYIECMLHYRPKAADDNVNLATHIYRNGSNYHSTGSSPYLSANESIYFSASSENSNEFSGLYLSITISPNCLSIPFDKLVITFLSVIIFIKPIGSNSYFVSYSTSCCLI